MPIEVRELVIKAAVTQESGSQTEASPGKGNNALSSEEEIIRSCVERVLEIIKEKTER